MIPYLYKYSASSSLRAALPIERWSIFFMALGQQISGSDMFIKQTNLNEGRNNHDVDFVVRTRLPVIHSFLLYGWRSTADK